MEPDELEDRTNDNDGECDVPYLEVEDVEPVFGVPRMAPIISAMMTLRDLCNTLGVPFVEFPNPTNEESSNEERGFLAEIVQNPLEDTPRLVYADWLDEHDRPERAELIRLQIQNSGDPTADIAPEIHREEELIRKLFPRIPGGRGPLRNYVRRGFYYRCVIARQMDRADFVKEFVLDSFRHNPIELVERRYRKPIRMVKHDDTVRWCWVRKSLNQIGLDPYMITPTEFRDLVFLNGENIHYGEYVASTGVNMFRIEDDVLRGRYIVGFKTEQQAEDALARSVCNTLRIENGFSPVIL